MSATVAAALKKIAVALLTNPKVIKTIGGVVLGIIIIIIMPIVAVVSIFNGDIEIDTDRLQTMVVENLSAEEQAKLQFVEDTMLSIESEMQAAGLGYDIIPVDRYVFCRIGQDLTNLISRFGADGLTGLAVIGHICEIAVFVGIALEQMRRDEITAVGNRRKRTDILQHRNLHILANGSGSKVDERQRFVIDAVALTEHVAAADIPDFLG